MAGTDTEAAPMVLGYIVTTAIVVLLASYRTGLAVAARQARRSAASATNQPSA